MKVIYSSVTRAFPAFSLVVADFCPAHVQALKSFFVLLFMIIYDLLLVCDISFKFNQTELLFLYFL